MTQQKLEEPQNQRQMTQWTLLYICLLFSGSLNFCHSMCFWPTALRFSFTTDFDILFLLMFMHHHLCVQSWWLGAVPWIPTRTVQCPTYYQTFMVRQMFISPTRIFFLWRRWVSQGGGGGGGGNTRNNFILEPKYNVAYKVWHPNFQPLNQEVQTSNLDNPTFVIPESKYNSAH